MITQPSLVHGAEDTKGFMLDEIVVTAQKRSERLTEVPISITALTSDTFEKNGVKELRQIGDLAPNLQFSQNNDFSSRITIRGVGANSRNIGFDSRVGLYLDGVYMGQSPAVNQGLQDLERVEILRGPQGTLFGKNTVAGAIHIISKKPTDEFAASFGASYGNYNAIELNATVNMPVSETTAVKFFVNKTDRDGYIKNLYDGTKTNEKDSYFGRIQIRSVLSDNLEMNISTDYAEHDRIATSGEALTSPFGNALPTDGRKKYEIFENVNIEEYKKLWGISLTLDYDFSNGYALKSITAYRDTKISYVTDVDHSEFDILNAVYTDTYKQTTQEFQLISPDEAAFKYVVGLYLYNQASETNRDIPTGSDILSIFGPAGPTPGASATTYDGTVKTTSFAVFMNGTYELTERLKLGFGFRYSQEKKDVDWSIDGTDSGFFGIATGTVIEDRTDKDFSPTVNLNYALNKDNFVYARFSTGYKSGGYNLDFVNASQFGAGIEFDKETVTSYEVGYKTEMLDNRLRANMALFYSKFNDYQVNQYVDLGGGRTALVISNAAQVSSKGFEADMTYLATARLKLTASIGVLETKFDSFPGGGSGGTDATGNKLPYAPKMTGSFGAEYNYPLPDLDAELVLRADFSHTSSRFVTVNNDSGHTLSSGEEVLFGELESYNTISARIGMVDEAGAWEVYLWGRNLTDSHHLNHSFREFLGTIIGGYAMPRTYGIEGKINF